MDLASTVNHKGIQYLFESHGAYALYPAHSTKSNNFLSPCNESSKSKGKKTMVIQSKYFSPGCKTDSKNVHMHCNQIWLRFKSPYPWSKKAWIKQMIYLDHLLSEHPRSLAAWNSQLHEKFKSFTSKIFLPWWAERRGRSPRVSWSCHPWQGGQAWWLAPTPCHSPCHGHVRAHVHDREDHVHAHGYRNPLWILHGQHRSLPFCVGRIHLVRINKNRII